MRQPDLVVELRLRNTLSFWVTALAGALSVHRRTRRAGAILLMAVGYGGVGVAWERTTGCDLRRLHRPPRLAVTGLASHFPLAVLGHLLWRYANKGCFRLLGMT